MSPLSSTSAETSEAAKSSTSAKNVAEHRENVVHREASSTAESSEATFHVGAVESELIVLLALLLVAQHAIGFGSFFEFLLGLFVARIAVWVIFDGNLSVSLLDFVISGLLTDAKYLVIVSLSHNSF